MTCSSPRIASRAVLLVILATARGVYATVEQPMTSMMKFFPDLVFAGELIGKYLGVWREQFLPGSRMLS